MGDRFRIENWLIEPRLNTVSRNGTTVRLEPKVMEVLVCLARHAGEPVRKEELLQTVWPNTFVTDDGLKRSISELRRVFEDDAREPRVIQTIPKRGYRLLVPVEPIVSVDQTNGAQPATIAPPNLEAPLARRRWRKLALLGAAALLLIAVGAAYVRKLRPSGPANSKAFDAYLQGNYHLTRAEWSVAEDDKHTAARYFQQAIDFDANFVPAYIGLANAHSQLALGSSMDISIAKKAAEKALALDSSSAEAWNILGHIKWIELDWAGAEQDQRRAKALNPKGAPCVCELGLFLAATGRLDEGLREAEIDQELNPTEDNLSLILEMRGDHDRAIALLQRAVALHPTDSGKHYGLFRNYAEIGKYEEAVQELESDLTLMGTPEIAAKVRRGFARSGYRGAMSEYATALEVEQADQRGFFPENLAIAYSAMGDKDRAFHWLDQAYEHRENVSLDWGLMIIKEDHMLDTLHSDPRFADLLRRVGLVP